MRINTELCSVLYTACRALADDVPDALQSLALVVSRIAAEQSKPEIQDSDLRTIETFNELLLALRPTSKRVAQQSGTLPKPDGSAN